MVAGRDSIQNEALLLHHLSKSDVIVHSDVFDSPVCVVKCQENRPLVTPKTLNEAGAFTLCYSSAWDNKAVHSAYWAPATLVKKLDSTGAAFPCGCFTLAGEKVFLIL